MAPTKARKLTRRQKLINNLGIHAKKANACSPSIPIEITRDHCPPQKPPEINDKSTDDDSDDSIVTHHNISREISMLNAGPRCRDVRTEVHLCHGNRIVAAQSLKNNIQNKLSCKLCARQKVHSELDAFASFCDNQPTVGGIIDLLQKHRSKYHQLDDFGSVKLTEETVGISTKIKCECENHGKVFDTKVGRTKYEGNKKGYNSYESYSLNCLLVMGMQQVGAGGTETDRLLSFLDLPNGNSFRRDRFKSIEDSLGKKIRSFGEKIIQESLEEEVRLSLEKKNRGNEYDDWKAGRIDASGVPITISYDMGWNKRSSGSRYDSISGHGIAIGILTTR